MLLPPNPKSLNGRIVFFQMVRGMSKTTARGFFDPKAGDDSIGPPSAADVALIQLIFLRALNGRQGIHFTELPCRVIRDEDKALGNVEACNEGFVIIFDQTS